MMKPFFIAAALTAGFSANAAQNVQINSIVDLAHSFTFYADGRFSSQYTPDQRWTRSLASFKALDLPNANANLFALFEPDRRVPFTAEDITIVRDFIASGGLVIAIPREGEAGFAPLLKTFSVEAAGQAPQPGFRVTTDLIALAPVESAEIKSRSNPLTFRLKEGKKPTGLWVTSTGGDPVVFSIRHGKGNLLVLPNNMISEDPGSRDRDYNAKWIRPLIQSLVTATVRPGEGPRGRDFTQQDFRNEVDGIVFHYNTYLAPCYQAMEEIILHAKPLIEKRMGVPLAGKNAGEIALLATGGGGFSGGQLVALAVFWEDFPNYRAGMYEFLTHELTHSWVLPFPEIWNEPIATYVGDLVMIDAGFPEEGKRRIQQNINRAQRLDPDMTSYDLDGKAAKDGARELNDNERNDIHWGKAFWVFETLAKENPNVLADYFQTKRKYADPAKIRRYGLNETVAVMSYAMGRDMFPWFAAHGMKADPAASAITYRP